MDANNPQDDGDDRFAGDLLVGADAIRAYLVGLGMPQSVDVYYLKRSGHWPIGNTAGTDGKIIASKRRLIRHLEKITRGPTAADRQRRARRRRRISQLLTWKRPAGLSLARGKARRPAGRSSDDHVCI
jgi:hypothetical protein